MRVRCNGFIDQPYVVVEGTSSTHPVDGVCGRFGGLLVYDDIITLTGAVFSHSKGWILKEDWL